MPFILTYLLLIQVRLKGLEPSRIAPPDPKSGVATNYTTAAVFLLKRHKVKFFFEKNNVLISLTLDSIYLYRKFRA